MELLEVLWIDKIIFLNILPIGCYIILIIHIVSEQDIQKNTVTFSNDLIMIPGRGTETISKGIGKCVNGSDKQHELGKGGKSQNRGNKQGHNQEV